MDIQLQDSLAESLRWRCKESASDTAIKFLDREQTYAEFDSNSNLVAQGLLDLGIEPNSRVAYLAKNTDYFFEIFFGSLKTKSVVVGVNWRLAAEEVAYVLEDSKIEVLFVSSDFFNIIDQIEEKLSLKKIICIDGDHKDWLIYEDWKKSFEDIDPNQWDKAMNVNVKGLWNCCRAISPIMRENKSGSIINIASLAAKFGMPYAADYATSKAAVIGLTRVMAREMGKDNIRVNAVAPSMVRTESAKEFLGEKAERGFEVISKGQILQKTLEVDDIYGTVLYLSLIHI